MNSLINSSIRSLLNRSIANEWRNDLGVFFGFHFIRSPRRLKSASFGLLVSSTDLAHVIAELVIAGGLIDHRRTNAGPVCRLKHRMHRRVTLTSSLPFCGGTSTPWSAYPRPRKTGYSVKNNLNFQTQNR